MPVYRYALIDASAGTHLGDLPLTVTTPFSTVLNGCGTLTGTVPLEHPMAVYTKLQGDREITVLRDDEPLWNGPITMLDASFSSRQVTITAREASWYLGKRVLEQDMSWVNGDVYQIMRDLVDYMTSKVSDGTDGMGVAGQNINAAIPRFYVDPPSGMSGTTKTLSYLGVDRILIGDILHDLVADPTTGLDYCMVYFPGTVPEACDRYLTLGSPSITRTNTASITETTLFDFGKQQDRERAANRDHVVGQGYSFSAQNASSITVKNDILVEAVFDKSDSSDHQVIRDYARDARRRTIPPVIPMQLTHVDSPDLPFGFCNLGDHLTLNIGGTTVLHSLGGIRIVEIDTMPESAASTEYVTLIGDVSLDDLGT